VPEFPSLFGQFELLGAFAFAERFEKAEIEAHIAKLGNGHGVIWFPRGLTRFNNSRLLQEVRADPLRAELSAAGFGKGEPALIDLYGSAMPEMLYWGS
jgi:hypothetical protein